MDTYHVVLYIHFVSLAIALMAAGVMLVCYLKMRAAQTAAEAGPWGMAAGETVRFFPVAIVGLFASGAYMTSDLWTWSTDWIEISILGLIVISLQGPLLAARRGQLLKNALIANGPGPLTGEARARTRDFVLWLVMLTNVLMVLGIVWNMTEKPGLAGSIASIVVAYAVGAAVAYLVTRPKPVAATATEPAA